MEHHTLKSLNAKSIPFLSAEAFIEGSVADMTPYLEDISREIDLSTLDAVIAEGMKLDRRSRDTDDWFAPRIHAALRISRSEAGHRGIWRYLALRYSRYVLWRWAKRDGKIAQVRITGRDNRHALARLWWAAELGRNGPDYAPVSKVFHNQDAALWFLDIDAFHNRPLALAYAEYVASRQLSGVQAQRLATRINFTLTTLPIDVIAPDFGVDGEAIRDWIETSPDYTLMKGVRLPEGPDDIRVQPALIDQVIQMISKIDVS